MKPLIDPCPEDLTAYAEPIGRLIDLSEAPNYQQTIEFFTGYPERALSSPGSRTFLYQATKALRPHFVVEIGSYYAGGSEVIARALHANGDGQLLTIDPYGADRVPKILERWPAELQKVTTFAPADSMGLFSKFEGMQPSIDIVFVDGAHEYGFALYDLVMSAKWIRPGGIAIVDDLPEPSVYAAVSDFLRINPGWRALGAMSKGADRSDPFGSMIRAPIPDTGFAVLVAPSQIEIREKSKSFDYGAFKSPGVAGFSIDAMDNAGGTLHAKVILRSFYTETGRGDPETVIAIVAKDVPAGGGKIDVAVEPPRLTSHDPTASLRHVELVLIWEGESNDSTLRLSEKPQITMVDDNAVSA